MRVFYGNGRLFGDEPHYERERGCLWGTMREVWIWWGICPRILARRLRTIVAESTELISAISLAIDESANAVMTLAMNTNDLVEKIAKVSRQMEDNSTISVKLKQAQIALPCSDKGIS